MKIAFKQDEFDKPVIAWQRITARNQFCLTKAGTVILDSMAFLSSLRKYEKYLLAVLNSKLVYYLPMSAISASNIFYMRQFCDMPLDCNNTFSAKF